MDKIIEADKCRWYICLSDDEACPEGYEGYIFPDDSYVKNIEYCKNNSYPNITIISNWINNNDEIEEAEAQISQIKNKLIDYLSSELNCVHRTSYASNEWRIMLGEWLSYYIPQYFDKYVRIKLIRKLNKQCICDVFDISSLAPTMDYVDFEYSLRHSETYHKYLYSQLLLISDNSSWLKMLVDGEYDHIPHRISWGKKTLLLGRLYDLFFKVMHFLTRKEDSVVLHFSLLPIHFVTNRCIHNIGTITNYIGIHNDIVDNTCRLDEAFRTVFALGNVYDEFERFIHLVVKRDIPKAYLENFTTIKKFAKKIYKYGYDQTKVAIFSATALCSDETFKSYLMDLRHYTHGKLHVVQHGGNYGIDATGVGREEAEICDSQYTWGWKRKTGFLCECIPMPAVLLLGRKKADNTAIRNRILFVDYSFPKHCSLFYREAIWHKEDFDSEIKYFNSLSEELIEKLYVRVFPIDYGWNSRMQIIQSNSRLKLDAIKDFDDSINASDLCVLACCSTTLIEALYANKPCLAYRRKGRLETNAEEIWSMLEDVGIICNDWDELLKQTEMVSKNINEWWNEEERQNAVNAFCENYAYNPSNAFDLWDEELQRYIS